MQNDRNPAPERRRAFLVAACAFALVALAVLAALLFERHLTLQRARQEATLMAALLEEDTARTFDGVDIALDGFATYFSRVPLPRHDAASRALMQAQLRRLPTVRAFFVIRPDGFIQHDTDYPRTPDVTLADRPYFRRYVEDPSMQRGLSEPLQSRSGTGWFLASTRRITMADGSFGGIVVAAVQLDSVSTLYKRLGLTAGQQMSLFHRDGRLLARYPADDANIGRSFRDQPVFASLVREAPAGLLETSGPPSFQARLVSYRALASQPLVVLFAVSKDAALASWRRTAAGALAALLVLAALTAAGVRMFVQRQEQQRRAETMRAAADELAQADRQKSHFLATLSHELRNVLGPIQNGLIILDRPESTPAQAQRAREIVQRQVAHMRSLVDDLLDISRVNSGKVRLEIRALDLVEVLAEAAAAAQGAMQAHEHRFETQLPPGPVRVQADRTRLQQVFGNLLGNAAKYTPRGGHVVLRARVEGNEAVVDVQDDGMGIPPAALARIFQMFEQVDSHLQHSQGGLGIGLALVHRLVALHGGRVEARSDGEGRGTTFTVHLPLGPSPQP